MADDTIATAERLYLISIKPGLITEAINRVLAELMRKSEGA